MLTLILTIGLILIIRPNTKINTRPNDNFGSRKLILNLFGVLKYKRMAEELLESSGLPYTIVRPNRLCDGPYTSYDLNTLLKGVAGERQDIILTLKDDQVGETSRIAVAESMVQSLSSPACVDATFSIGSAKLDGDGGNAPGTDEARWHALFDNLLS